MSRDHSGRVWGLQFTFEQQEELPAVSGKLFSIENCTAPRFKATERFLHPPVMCQLRFLNSNQWTLNFVSGDKSEALRLAQNRYDGSKQQMLC